MEGNMPGNFKKEDLRIIKTKKALETAFLSLLRRQQFAKITIFDICEEAMVSRAAFYTHFDDKYDLLKRCLGRMRSEFLAEIRKKDFPEIDEFAYDYINGNISLITNVMQEANSEQTDIILGLFSPSVSANSLDLDHTAFCHFFAGGLFNLMWLRVKNKHVSEEKMRAMILHLHKLLKAMIDWDRRQRDGI
jgi:AcrR family transcriptional regulator